MRPADGKYPIDFLDAFGLRYIDTHGRIDRSAVMHHAWRLFNSPTNRNDRLRPATANGYRGRTFAQCLKDAWSCAKDEKSRLDDCFRRYNESLAHEIAYANRSPEQIAADDAATSAYIIESVRHFRCE